MARQAVCSGRISIKLACHTFGVSVDCYRYQPRLSSENAQIADLLTRLAHNQPNWGVWLVLSVPAQREGLSLEPQTGVSDLPRTGTESADQTAQAHREGKARASYHAGSDQPVLVNGLHA